MKVEEPHREVYKCVVTKLLRSTKAVTVLFVFCTYSSHVKQVC